MKIAFLDGTETVTGSRMRVTMPSMSPGVAARCRPGNKGMAAFELRLDPTFVPGRSGTSLIFNSLACRERETLMSIRSIYCRRFISSLLGLTLSFLLAEGAVADHREGHVDVTVPQLSEMAAFGQTAFNETCAKCHGENGAGTEKGPPLVHPIYNPGHHSDQSIYNAIRNGVRQHHWPYGDMPKQDGIGFYESSAIVKFIREVQNANGIVNQQHR